MKIICKCLLLFLFLISGLSCQKSQSNLELRLAERNPHPGYVKREIYGIGSPIFLSNEISLAVNDIKNASVYENTARKSIEMRISLKDSDKIKLQEITHKNIGKEIAILINGRVVTAMRVVYEVKNGAIGFPIDKFEEREIKRILKGFGMDPNYELKR